MNRAMLDMPELATTRGLYSSDPRFQNEHLTFPVYSADPDNYILPPPEISARSIVEAWPDWALEGTRGASSSAEALGKLNTCSRYPNNASDEWLYYHGTAKPIDRIFPIQPATRNESPELILDGSKRVVCLARGWKQAAAAAYFGRAALGDDPMHSFGTFTRNNEVWHTVTEWTLRKALAVDGLRFVLACRQKDGWNDKSLTDASREYEIRYHGVVPVTLPMPIAITDLDPCTLVIGSDSRDEYLDTQELATRDLWRALKQPNVAMLYDVLNGKP